MRSSTLFFSDVGVQRGTTPGRGVNSSPSCSFINGSMNRTIQYSFIRGRRYLNELTLPFDLHTQTMTICRFYLCHFAPSRAGKRVSCVQFEFKDPSAEKHAASACWQSRKMAARYSTNFKVLPSREGAA